MFKLTPKLKRLDVPFQSVLRLQRSLGDVQTAFPGWPSQRATAYVCAFSTEKGARVAVAFFMKESCELVFYLNDEGDVSRADLGKVFSDGIYFAESLGFMLGDVNLTYSDASEKEAAWKALPLSNPPAKPAPSAPPAAVQSQEPQPGESQPAAAPPAVVAPPAEGAAKGGGAKRAAKPQADAAVTAQKAVVAKSQPAAAKVPAATKPSTGKQAGASPSAELDLGLPTGGALLALRRRKEPPSAEELDQKRQRLRENLGRFFASM